MTTDHDWRAKAACATTPDLWNGAGGRQLGEARHICLRHCPVLRECGEDAARTSPDLRASVVLGGLRHNHRGEVARQQPLEPVCHICRPLDRSEYDPIAQRRADQRRRYAIECKLLWPVAPETRDDR